MDLDNDGKQELVVTSLFTQPAIVIASVSDFDLPVWTVEFENSEIGGTAPDIAAIGIGDLDGDGTPEVILTEGASEQLVIIEASAANTYEQFTAPMPLAGRTVSVHGIETGDANGDGFDEAYIANLQGAVWVVSTTDVSTFTSDDIYLIALDTLAQFLETGFGSLTPTVGKTANAGVDFVIAGSNDSNARDYQYIGGPGGDPDGWRIGDGLGQNLPLPLRERVGVRGKRVSASKDFLFGRQTAATPHPARHPLPRGERV